MMVDPYGRRITYLRVSVTDRCNLRCRYCMPPGGVAERAHDEILRYEEIERLVRAAVGLGVSKVRLTGGEPLVRKGIVGLVRMLRGIPGLQDLSMTTNGTLLARHAHELAAAGLDRVNVSLDTLRPDRFAYITRLGRLEDVLAGLAAAEDAGLRPIRLNCVVARGVNDDEVADLAALTLERDWAVRFIEFMPISRENLGFEGGLVPMTEVRRALEVAHGALQPVEQPDDALSRGPARYWRLPGARGSVGFISPVSEHFCATCNRVRLTADGRLRLCLLQEREVDLRAVLRGGADDAALADALREAIRLKPAAHDLARDLAPADRRMAQIGG